MAKKKDEGFDPEGDGPSFRGDRTPSDLPPDEARKFAIKMSQVRRSRSKKPKQRKEPTQAQIERGIARQAHMNNTQFREPEDRGPNPNYTPPPPGSPGGPPLPRPKPEDE